MILLSQYMLVYIALINKHIILIRLIHYLLFTLLFALGTSEEREVTTTEPSHTLRGLRKFTDYNIWVAAFNANGAGRNSDDVTVKTLSDGMCFHIIKPI